MREFPHNHWWVAARTEDVGRELLERVVLGTPVLLYRTTDGRAVALDNRCVHRSFPLSKGKLVGDEVQCGYHGFRYDTTGACVCIPSQEHVASRVRVKAYPVVERFPYVWVWIGDDEAADESLVPDPGLVNEDDWRVLSGTMHIKGSWRAMHDNLLDLTHLTYLHNGVGGTEAYAQVAPEVESDGRTLTSTRSYVDDSPGAGWALGITTPIERWACSTWRSPALITAEVRMTDIEAKERGEESTATIHFIHSVTPETSGALNYHWVVARNFARDVEAVTKMFYDQTVATFLEDQDAMEWIRETMERYPRTDPPEISVKADAGGLQARRLIEALLQDKD